MASAEPHASAPAASVKHFSTFLPLTLFGLTLLILLGNEILTLKTEIEATNSTIASRAEAAAKAEQNYTQLTKVIGDIVTLARTDETTARIAKGYNLIQMVETGTASEKDE